MREDRVESNAGHTQRERAEQRQQRRATTPWAHLSLQQIAVGPDLDKRQIGAPIQHRATNWRDQIRQRRLWCEPAGLELLAGTNAGGRSRHLRKRNEVLHQAILAAAGHDRSLTDVARHTDDLAARHASSAGRADRRP